ncbi:MAG: MFS transporter, partial [Oscillospiraceae bacterium]
MEKYKLTKYSCYTANASMSVVSALTPLLFLTFHNLYGITYTMLGALVLINFSTQLFVDLIFSFYSHKFNITKMVKIIPILTFIGLIVYAVFPFLFPNAVYLGLVIGTVIFASSGGLVEVLLSPVIAEIPSENPEREMSKLHSVYAWGVVGVVIISSLFLLV